MYVIGVVSCSALLAYWQLRQLKYSYWHQDQINPEYLRLMIACSSAFN